MNQATQPSAESLSGAVRALEQAVYGLRHSQNILVAAIGIVAALFLGALVWLAADISALRQQVATVETTHAGQRRRDQLADRHPAR